MKAIIVYNSKTDFTKSYASWIQEETGFEMKVENDTSKQALESYDLVIYGGGIYAGRINGYKQFVKKVSDQSRLILFATGATPVDAEDIIKTMWNNNLSKEEQEKIPHYYFQSGLSYEKMKLGDRMLMKAFSKILSKKENKSPEEVASEQAICHSYDISSKEFIKPLLEYIKQTF